MFDFALPSYSAEQVAFLHARAEYLLDEMEMGAADFSAADSVHMEAGTTNRVDVEHASNPSFPASAGPDETRSENGASLQSDSSHPVRHDLYASSLEQYLEENGPQSEVVPNDSLPAIRSRVDGSDFTNGREADDRSEAQMQSRSTSVPAAGQMEAEERGWQDEPILTERPLSRGHSDTAAAGAAPPGDAGAHRARHASTSRQTISVTESRARQLQNEITGLAKRVRALQESRREITGHALSLLEEADAIAESEPQRLGRAEYNLRQVRTTVARAEDSRRRSIRYAIQLLLYLGIWLVLCVGAASALYLYSQDLVAFITANVGAGSILSVHAISVLWCLLAGAMGGVLGAMASLISLMRAGQDFDRQYVVRYGIQPIMGLVIALFIYGLVQAMYTNLEIDVGDRLLLRMLPAVLAFPAGLWQEVVYSLLYRVTRFFSFRSRRR